MKTIHKKRLQKLITFLRKLPRKEFDFSVVRDERDCGAVACAIGWAQRVFPKHMLLDDLKEPMLRPSVREKEGIAAMTEFREIAVWLTGLDEDRAKSLFMPGEQSLTDPRLPFLGNMATPKQVAAMLEKFIKLQEGK